MNLKKKKMKGNKNCSWKMKNNNIYYNNNRKNNNNKHKIMMDKN